jgi:hypothetical protein
MFCKMLCLLTAFFVLSCNTSREADFSELFKATKARAPSEFKRDASGLPYDSTKPWRVCTTFEPNPNLDFVLRHGWGGIDTLDVRARFGTSLRFLDDPARGLKSVKQIDSTYKAVNDYYLVIVLPPLYNPKRQEYVTCLWLRDQSWACGFQIFVRFHIDSGKAQLVQADYVTISGLGVYD